MNTKTTLYLAVSLALLGASYFILRSQPATNESEATTGRGALASSATRDLGEEELGEVVKVVCERKGYEAWVFEKTKADTPAGQDEWNMTAPAKARCVSWEVDRFENRLGNLQYELSYKPGDPGAVTAKEAGLDPPEAVVTLTDDTGMSIRVEIGNSPSSRETYVRLAGSDEIAVAKSNLADLFKDSALAYRDKQLWRFDSDKVTRVEIDDRSESDSPVAYVLAKDGSRWMMESPITARATSKVDQMLRTMATMRVLEWQENDPTKLGVYGLDPGSLAVRVTVEEEVPVPTDEEAEAPATDDPDAAEKSGDDDEPATETKVTVYELLFSDQSPIGEDTKSYVRVAGENAVATVMKSAADKFKPVMAEWRDMKLTSADVSAANRIELVTSEGTATLVNRGGDWSFDPDGGRAEASVVSELLSGLASLSAVVFMDTEAEDVSTYGLDRPETQIRLTIPGVEGVERFVVGAYTDETTKRLVYVRRNEGTPVAKVRTADIQKLVRGPQVYRDRTIIDVLPSRFERITLSSENTVIAGRSELTLSRAGNDWSITEPSSAETRQDAVDKLLAQLGGLRAERVVGDESQLTAYGLHAPAATVALTFKVVGETPAPSETDAAEAEDSASRTIELAVAAHDGEYYAKLADRPTIYQISKEFFTQLGAEYRTDRVVEFDDTKVDRFSIRHGDVTHTFVKQGEKWAYEAEPDLPLDSNKVKNLLLQIKDLRTPRYARYVGADLAQFDLDSPQGEVTVHLSDGTERVLLISERLGGVDTDRGFFAAIKGQTAVFLLTESSANRFEVSLEDLEDAR